MKDLASDAVINAIYNGIKRDIEVAISNNCLRAGVILIYAGMDAMAFLNMPPGKTEVARKDFIKWADKYVEFPCINQISGVDFYGARCSMLHAYGAVSKLSKSGECRMIGYMDKSMPEVRYNPKISAEIVLVSIPALKNAFFNGIDKFLLDVFSDKAKAKIVEERLETFVHAFPAKK